MWFALSKSKLTAPVDNHITWWPLWQLPSQPQSQQQQNFDQNHHHQSSSSSLLYSLKRRGCTASQSAPTWFLQNMQSINQYLFISATQRIFQERRLSVTMPFLAILIYHLVFIFPLFRARSALFAATATTSGLKVRVPLKEVSFFRLSTLVWGSSSQGGCRGALLTSIASSPWLEDK